MTTVAAPNLLPPIPAERPPAPHWYGRRRFWAAVAAIGVGIALAFDAESILAVVILLVLVAPFEKLFPRHRQRLRRPGVATDIAYALAAGPSNAIGLIVGLLLSAVTFVGLPGLLLRPLVMAIPALPRAVLGVFIFDFAVYWVHRFGHEVPFLWRFHKIHHSTEHLDWVSGFRGHPLDGAFLAPAFVVLIVAGFSPEFGGALVIVQIITGLFLHANVRWRWRPLHRVVITPEFHHWHHANEPGARNSNYSVGLPLWDLVFGTYFMPSDRRPMVYGIDGGIVPGMAAQWWEPLRGLRNPLLALVHPIRALRAVRAMTSRGVRQAQRSIRGEASDSFVH